MCHFVCIYSWASKCKYKGERFFFSSFQESYWKQALNNNMVKTLCQYIADFLRITLTPKTSATFPLWDDKKISYSIWFISEPCSLYITLVNKHTDTHSCRDMHKLFQLRCWRWSVMFRIAWCTLTSDFVCMAVCINGIEIERHDRNDQLPILWL